MLGGRELLSLPQVQQWGLDMSQSSNLAFPFTVLYAGGQEAFPMVDSVLVIPSAGALQPGHLSRY